jgi:7-cyano-7-deazaguanine reductase
MTEKHYEELTLLGRKVAPPPSPQEAQLETFVNPHPGLDYVVRLTASEFTTLCPLTGPRGGLVESKSFKLFLWSFRNQGIFHEDGTVYIHKRLEQALQPQYLRVVGLWNVRGGIAIDVVIESGDLPSNCRLLPLGKSDFRGGRE